MTSSASEQQNAPPRRSSSGDKTRQRLIEAGIEVFGQHGYDGATTRMLTQAAGVNLAAIPYHFGGKEPLYHEVVKTIGERILSAFANERATLFKLMNDANATRADLQQVLDNLICGFARVLIASETGRQAAPIMMREQAHPTKAFDQLYDAHLNKLHQMLTQLVARLKGIPPESDAAILCTHAIIGQVMVFRMMRELAIRRLNWPTFNDDNIEQICAVILDNVHRILSAPSTEPR